MSEILMIRRVLRHRCKILFVVPFVSIVTEKAKDFSALFKDRGKSENRIGIQGRTIVTYESCG